MEFLKLADFRNILGNYEIGWSSNLSEKNLLLILAENLCFPFQAFYYFAMVEDLIFRLLWTLTVSVGELEIFHSEILKLILSVCEVFR